MKRRGFLALTASLSGCSTYRGSQTSTGTASGKSPALKDAEKLESLLNEDVIKADENYLFLGNPSFFDYGFSSIDAKESDGDGFIDKRLSAGYKPEQIWEDVAKSRDAELGNLLDSTFTDPIEYDILQEEKLGVIVINSTDREVETASERLEIEMSVDHVSSENWSFDETERFATQNPDHLVYNIYQGDGTQAGVSAPDRNLALINAGIADSSEDPVAALSNIMRHEGYHVAVNHPHLKYGGSNLMSVQTQSAANAELTDQAKDIIKRYAEADLVYDATEEDGVAKLSATFRPTSTIERGEEYLLQNTKNMLEQLGFPYQAWNFDTEDNTVYMKRNDVVVELEPGTVSGYDNVNVESF